MWGDLAWRLFRHEARRGELSIILAAIVLSVAAVLSLSLFSARLQTALSAKSAEFMASDRQLTSNSAVDPEWLDKARESGLNTAQQRGMRSMVFANDNMVLADVRAVNEQYPLKGKVKSSDDPFAIGVETDSLPEPGNVWIDSRLFQVLKLNIGDKLEIGDALFTVSKVVADIPDRGFSVFGNDHLVLMRLVDLDSTNLAGPGSRVGYRYFFTGSSGDLDSYYDWLEPQLNSELHRWVSIEDDDTAIGNSVRRAERFFLLASLLAIVLASVSIAVAAQRYSQRHFDPVAIMKTLGASRSWVQKVYLTQILLITVFGIILGVIVGYSIQQLVVWLVAERVPVSIDSWHWRPLVVAVFTGFICAVLFSLYPLMKLFSVPPLRVLRRDLGAGMSARFIQFLASGSAIFLLMWAYSGNLRISLILFVCGVLLVLGLLLVTMGLIRVGRKLGQGNIGPWQLAWARIRRRAMDNSVQLISFSVTLLLLLVVLVMRNDMVSQWRQQLPEGTPNYFLANITDNKLANFQQHFADLNVETGDLYPIVRGRLAAIDQESVRTAVSKEDEDEEENNGRGGLGREANLSWTDTLQEGNTIIAGEWLSADITNGPEVSVEQGVAERLDIKLNDMLSFNIGGQTMEAKVTSLREVNWQSMRPNFFFILQPAAMADFSPTYITSFHLPPERKSELTQLMAPFSSVSLFDIDARINQLREIIDQVSLAVEFILILVLAAGSLVLIAQVQSSMDERLQELAILRTLGAKGRLIRLSVIFEFVIIGVVAGAMAAIANELTLYLLQTQIFNMEANMHWDFWLLSPLMGAAIVGVLGAVSCWRLLRLNTAAILRQML
ncbi:FtsX-like permease family protein [Alteromonadaceae bacterium BrNp21-10]|nr:FtsX-like permease family protein [Alteromonadaceae bacterium BrNp21-10]